MFFDKGPVTFNSTRLRSAHRCISVFVLKRELLALCAALFRALSAQGKLKQVRLLLDTNVHKSRRVTSQSTSTWRMSAGAQCY